MINSANVTTISPRNRQLQSSVNDLYNYHFNQNSNLNNNNNSNKNNVSTSNGLLVHNSQTLAQLPVDGSINAHAHRRSFDISLHPIPFVDPMMLSPAMRRTFSMSNLALPAMNTINTNTNMAAVGAGLLRTSSRNNITQGNNSHNNNNTNNYYNNNHSTSITDNVNNNIININVSIE